MLYSTECWPIPVRRYADLPQRPNDTASVPHDTTCTRWITVLCLNSGRDTAVQQPPITSISLTERPDTGSLDSVALPTWFYLAFWRRPLRRRGAAHANPPGQAPASRQVYAVHGLLRDILQQSGRAVGLPSQNEACTSKTEPTLGPAKRGETRMRIETAQRDGMAALWDLSRPFLDKRLRRDTVVAAPMPRPGTC